MKGPERFRWLTYTEWERAGRSGPGGLAVGALEFLGAAALLIAFRHEWWATLVVPVALAVDYTARSIVAHRRLGPARWQRSPFRIVSFGEWERRAKERRGILLVGSIYLASLAATVPGQLAVIAMLLLFPADYLWCCASSGAWLASRPPPPVAAASA